MTTYLPAAIAGTALTAAAIVYGAATAHAGAPESSYLYESASQAAGDLMSQGYSVEFDGSPRGDLSTCAVTRLDGFSATPSGTVHLTVDCHDGSTGSAV
jgi:hypothetical protein